MRATRRLLPLVLPLLLLAGLAALAACGRGQPAVSPTPADPGAALVDPVSRALLAAYGQTPVGATRVEQVVIGDPTELPWSLYLEASRKANLDFSALEGAGADLRVTPIRGAEPDAKAYVLVRGGQALGAWIGPGGSSSGVLSLADLP